MSWYKEFEMTVICDTNDSKFIIDAIDDWHKYAYKIIDALDEVPIDQIRLMGYFSLIDCMAQNTANYSLSQQQKHFADFIIKYQSCCTFLEQTDPVTLYYRTKELLGDKMDLTGLTRSRMYNVTEVISKNFTSEIITGLSQVVEERDINKYMRQHRYVDLLYRLRCRVSHEFTSSYVPISKTFSEPYYIDVSREYATEDGIKHDSVWQLKIPTIFVKNLCLNCIDNYLKECKEKNILPLSNDNMSRLCELSWYNQ